MPVKTLIINGSTRKNGDIEGLLKALEAELKGEVRTLSMQERIAPCADCRYCWHRPGCRIEDRMQEVYPYVEACDNIVLASPVWFSSLSGPMLDITSRLQTYFSARFIRREPAVLRSKRGLVILTGGQRGTEKAPVESAGVILKLLNTTEVMTVTSMDTDHIPAAQDLQALEEIRQAAGWLNAKLDI